MRIVSPSILACNFLKLEEEITKINNSKAKWIHFDVMDGHFVPNISFGSDIFKYFKKNSKLFMDVHIMVSNPRFVAEIFCDAGADQIVFHYEACQSASEISDLIKYLKKRDVKVGIALKPKTEAKVLLPFIDELDMVLIMSVEPGFGGQKFDASVLDKVKKLKEIKPELLIQIDGGINDTNKELCYEAGVNCLVAGSYLFKQADFNKGVEFLL